MSGTDIAIAWNELPVYGARLIRAACRANPDHRIHVLATKPSVPIQDVERHLGQPVVYVESRGQATWRELDLKTPKAFFHTGWAYAQFNRLAEEVRQQGGSVISMVDNRWKGNLRQRLGAIYFRAVLQRKFSAVWVPGKSGQRLATFLGVPPHRVVPGLYGADPEIFPSGPSLDQRPFRIIFVGQYTARKGVDLLSEAWKACARKPWELWCFGQGPLRESFQAVPHCRVFPFRPPEEIAMALREARFLVLPSRDDHWGLVVHEAALSGTGLIVSDHVGAALDLVEPENGKIFRSGDLASLKHALSWAQALDSNQFAATSQRSVELAQRFGPRVWAQSFQHCLQIAGVAKPAASEHVSVIKN